MLISIHLWLNMPNLQSVRVTDGCQLSNVSRAVTADIGFFLLLLFFGGFYLGREVLALKLDVYNTKFSSSQSLIHGVLLQKFSLFILDPINAINYPQNSQKKSSTWKGKNCTFSPVLAAS